MDASRGNLGMATRAIEIEAGGEGASIEIVIRGCHCRVQDMQDVIAAFAREWVRDHPFKGDAQRVVRPCGCGGNDAS